MRSQSGSSRDGKRIQAGILSPDDAAENIDGPLMKLVSGTLRLSPTDLANYAACPHLTALDTSAAQGALTPQSGFSHVTYALRKRGEAHETAYLDLLRATGFEIESLAALPLDATGAAATLHAMQRGVQVIVQAPLLQQGWAGRADVLQRVSSPSAMGVWSYEPLDTKLARETRGSAILQLCAYAAALQDLQQLMPEHLHVVSPGFPFTKHTFRHSDYAAYYRLVRGQLERRVQSSTPVPTYPDPVVHCEICRWSNHCDAHRRKDDHLSLVANIRTLQIGQLQTWGVQTLEALGNEPVPFLVKPARGTLDGLHRAREQARVQLAGRQTGTLVYELLPLKGGAGLYRLPEPSPGDVFFDLEGDPFVPPDGREYLFGHVYCGEGGRAVYTPVWALTPSDEKAAFEGFVDFVMERWRRHPALHIYHYAPYEPGAMKRLMGRYATREDEVDSMLRAEVFVDLYGVVRQGVRASVERYSIKTMERFYEFTRQIPLAAAGQHLHAVEMLLEFGGADQIPQDSKTGVEQYNEDDCLSARELRDWLETLRADAIADGQDIPRPVLKAPAPGPALSQRQAAVRALMERLLAGLPVAGEERSAEQQAMWLLAQMLEFHRREDKAAWWDYFRLVDMSVDDYADEPSALAGLQFVARVGGADKAPIHRYSFPPQEFKSPDDEAHYGKDEKLGFVDDCDIEARTIDIKKMVKTATLHPENVFFFGFVRTDVIQDALFELATWVADHGLSGPGPYRAVRDLLLARPPRLMDGCDWRVAAEIAEVRARRLTLGLDESVLPVQGPPGSGKTYVEAQMICELVKHGRTVGVTGNSHKVIRNLLDNPALKADINARYVNALQVARRWRGKLHPKVAMERADRFAPRHTLDKYADLAGYPDAAELREAEPAKWIRHTLRQLESTRGLYRRTTQETKRDWHKLLKYNRHDCLALRHIVLKASRELECWRAYEATRFCVDDGARRICFMAGSRSSKLDALLKRLNVDHWAFLTAWNPASIALSRKQNDARQRKLEEHGAAAGYTLLPGVGVGADPEWPPEECFLILGLTPRRAVAMGRRFEQLAIVAGRRGGPARLLPCGKEKLVARHARPRSGLHEPNK